MGRKADTRERMVEAGVTLFGRSGYTNVSLIDVVEAANAPRGSIYHHFPGGKEELAAEVAAAWKYRIERDSARLASRASTPEAFLDAVIDGTKKTLVSSDYTEGCPMSGIVANVGATPDEPLRDAVGATFTGWVDALAAGLIRQGIERNYAEHIAFAVVIALEGAITVSRATRTSAPFAHLHEMAATLLANAERTSAAQ